MVSQHGSGNHSRPLHWSGHRSPCAAWAKAAPVRAQRARSADEAILRHWPLPGTSHGMKLHTGCGRKAEKFACLMLFLAGEHSHERFWFLAFLPLRSASFTCTLFYRSLFFFTSSSGLMAQFHVVLSSPEA